MIASPTMKKNTKTPQTRETLKLRTNVDTESVTGSCKRTEDLDLKIKNKKVIKKKIQLYSSYMLVTFLVIMLLQLSQLSQTLPLWILDNHAIWMSWTHRDCYMISFSIRHLERNTRPSQVIPSSLWLWPKRNKTKQKKKKLRSCCAAMWNCLLHSSECETTTSAARCGVWRTCQARLSTSPVS